MTQVRLATVGDAAQVAALWNGMIMHSLATFTTQPKSDEELRQLIKARADAFWVLADQTVHGFVTFGAFRSGPGYAATVEHTVMLADDQRRKGGGRRLMQAAETAAVSRGVHVMVAGISSANPDAMSFHARLGFVETARMPQVGRKAGQWLDLILMQKTITAP